MLAAQRRQAIRLLRAERPTIRIVELAAELHVSRDTVRNDRRLLAAEAGPEGGHASSAGGDLRREGTGRVSSGGGIRARSAGQVLPGGRVSRLRKVGGGSVRLGLGPERSDPYAPAKVRVAEAAVRLVRPGQTIALTAGNTTRALARAVARIPGVVVVTNSLPVARLLGDVAPGVELVLTGGERGIVDALLGPIALEAVRSLNVDWLFMGANGVDGRGGVTAFDLGEAELHREWIQHAGAVAVLADHSKWGARALSTVLPLSEVGVLVTDEDIPAEAKRVVKRSVRELILAPTERPYGAELT